MMPSYIQTVPLSLNPLKKLNNCIAYNNFKVFIRAAYNYFELLDEILNFVIL